MPFAPAPPRRSPRTHKTSAPAPTLRRRASALPPSTSRPAKTRTRRPGLTRNAPAPLRRLTTTFKSFRPAPTVPRHASASQRSGTAAAFSNYVQKFGSGAHVAEARQRAAALDARGRKELPGIDIQKTCKAAAGAMVSLMGGTTTEQDINACLDSEQKARDQIIKDGAT